MLYAQTKISPGKYEMLRDFVIQIGPLMSARRPNLVIINKE